MPPTTDATTDAASSVTTDTEPGTAASLAEPVTGLSPRRVRTRQLLLRGRVVFFGGALAALSGTSLAAATGRPMTMWPVMVLLTVGSGCGVAAATLPADGTRPTS